MSRLRVLPLFSAVFAVLYAIAMYFNISMFDYYPTIGQFHWNDKHPDLPGPVMYWYGWISYAALGAAVVAALVAALPQPSMPRALPALSWAVPLAAMLFILYFIRGWFIA